jgi:hypothetical protein
MAKTRSPYPPQFRRQLVRAGRSQEELGQESAVRPWKPAGISGSRESVQGQPTSESPHGLVKKF